jgi:hypothetical protein
VPHEEVSMAAGQLVDGVAKLLALPTVGNWVPWWVMVVGRAYQLALSSLLGAG